LPEGQVATLLSLLAVPQTLPEHVLSSQAGALGQSEGDRQQLDLELKEQLPDLQILV
jgi:hypothetical protein